MAILPRLCAAASVLGLALPAAGSEPFVYQGMCEASAAAALGAKRFIVASDESNTLLLYERENAKPLGKLELEGFLKAKKSDLEGAATIGQRIYWISSHSLSKKGEHKPERYRFFALDISQEKPRPEGQAYTRLLDDLLKTPLADKYGLKIAAGKKPEDDGGLNIEGLTATPENTLLIGFRNPLPHGRALLVPLTNPAELIAAPKDANPDAKPVEAQFGDAIELELNGLGIRSIEPAGNGYLIVAGPTGDKGGFALYRWSGKSGDLPRKLAVEGLEGLSPEALFAIPNSNKFVLLSDDGGNCKPGAMTFRSVTVKLP
ncbi:DUF3616 domain-containing protein [Pseudoduganella violacea]|uniref:DUF3616 domain-containing protein n=1 Tax=Pseudoduganella violacea TaxID=1715466 RepID=A0A7W5FTK3_9BURK|nr:DUF3616 domain-containing protein [Pseudoduganella violacea]MBB3118894.1 hypothetical protein [Pseudoduganella violacea]